MDILWGIAGILAFGFLINVLLKQSYNFVFIMAQKPWVWIGISGLIALTTWGLSSSLEWQVSLPAWASALALFWNLPPRSKDLRQNESKSLLDEIYEEMGIKHGRLLFRLGLTTFIVTSIASWILFYGEHCSNSRCVPIIETLLS